MGLFDDATFKYGGCFYRKFSQSIYSRDLENCFPNDPILQSGICAAQSVYWIRHYLTYKHLYSNSIMVKNSHDIIMLQRALRYRDQSLVDFLILSGMKTVDGHIFDYKIDSKNLIEISNLISVSSGITVFSYLPQEGGRHVACAFVDNSKTLFFCDIQKGDVMIRFPQSKSWLNKYIKIIHDAYIEFKVSFFLPQWNEYQFLQALKSTRIDAIYYKPDIDNVSKVGTRDDLATLLKSNAQNKNNEL